MMYYSNEQACLIYLKNKGVAYMAMEGFVSMETLKGIVTKFNDMCRRQQVNALLFDASKLEIMKRDEIQWMKDHLKLNASNNALLRIGIVKPENAFGELSINQLFNKNLNVPVKKFNQIEEAEFWAFDLGKCA